MVIEEPEARDVNDLLVHIEKVISDRIKVTPAVEVAETD